MAENGQAGDASGAPPIAGAKDRASEDFALWFALAFTLVLIAAIAGTYAIIRSVTDDVTEHQQLALCLVAGVVGAIVHAATSFSSYMGNMQFKTSWIWWYALRVQVGVGLALLSYYLARATFLSGSDTPPDAITRIASFGLVGGVAGMFSKQFADKLSELVDTMFQLARPFRRDPLNPAPRDERAQVAIDSIKLDEKAKTAIIAGKNLDRNVTVKVAGSDAKPEAGAKPELLTVKLGEQFPKPGATVLIEIFADGKPLKREQVAGGSAPPAAVPVLKEPAPIKSSDGTQNVVLAGTGLAEVKKVEIGGQRAELSKDGQTPTALPVRVDAAALKVGSHAISLDGKDSGKKLTVVA